MPSGNSPPENKPHWTLLTVALFVIGILIVVPSGLCTALGLIYTAVTFSARSADFWTDFYLILVPGGVSIAAGLAILLAGLKYRPRV